MVLNAQRQEVNAWLEEIFGDEAIPEFEVNPTTIQHLHELMLINRKKDNNVQLVLDDLEQKTNEYNSEAQRVSAILSRLNMSSNNLSQSGISSVRTLAKLGTLLDIKDSSDSCYFLALQDLDDQLEQVDEQRQQEARRLKQLTTRTHSIILKCSSLNLALDNVKVKVTENQPVYERRKSDIAFLVNKIKKYGKEITKLQTQLTDSKVEKSIFHENLVKKSEMLKSLQDKLAPMQTELQSYSSLPPDLTEVKIKIEQQKRELAELEKQVAESIDISLV